MTNDARPSGGAIPPELALLTARIESLPARFREQLRPIAEDAAEQARFRDRILSVAREGLERYRLELAMARFDLEATRREREGLRQRLESIGT